jgi:hypothetical protein
MVQYRSATSVLRAWLRLLSQKLGSANRRDLEICCFAGIQPWLSRLKTTTDMNLSTKRQIGSEAADCSDLVG